jgi:hypothetical protein
VVADTTIPSPNGSEHNYIITGVAPGGTKIVVSSSGLSDTVSVAVLPLNFAGTVSNLTPRGGDTVVVTSTAVLKFDSTASFLAFGPDGDNDNDVAIDLDNDLDFPPNGTLLRRTRDSLVYLMPFDAKLPVRVTSVVVTYVPGLLVTLALATPPVLSGDRWAPGDTGYASAPTLPLPTVTGQSLQYLTKLPSVSNDANCGEGTGAGGVGKCTIFMYTANGTDSLQFKVNWTPGTTASTDNSDIDIYSCGAAGVSACFEGGAAGAAGASVNTPEVFTFKPTAGVHYLVIEQYSAGEDINVAVTITKKN